MEQKKKRKYHFGWQGEHPFYVYSVCGTCDCNESQIDETKRPQVRDRCKLCDRIARNDNLLDSCRCFWFRRRED